MTFLEAETFETRGVRRGFSGVGAWGGRIRVEARLSFKHAWIWLVLVALLAITGRVSELHAQTVGTHHVLERFRADPNAWPEVTLLIAPSSSSGDIPSDQFHAEGIRISEGMGQAKVPAEKIERFVDTGQPVVFFLVADAHLAMKPYWADLMNALSGFSQQLAQKLPGSELHVFTHSSKVVIHDNIVPMEWAYNFPNLETSSEPGRGLSDALCMAGKMLSRFRPPTRKILLILSDGLDDPDVDPSYRDECDGRLREDEVPAYVAGFSPVGWEGELEKAAELRLRKLAWPYGRYRRIETPGGRTGVPDLVDALNDWVSAVTGSLIITHRVQTAPPATIRLVIWEGSRPVPAVVTLTVEPQSVVLASPWPKTLGFGLLALFLAAVVVQAVRIVSKSRAAFVEPPETPTTLNADRSSARPA